MKNNKKAIIIISAIVVCIIAIVAVVLGIAFKAEKSIILKDSTGSQFATVTWDGYDVTYSVNNEYEKEYAIYAFKEAKDLLVKNGNTDENDIYNYIFENVTWINTNYDFKMQSLLQDAYNKNNELKSTSCAMAVTDLNGRLVAVFSNNTEENLSLTKTYAGSTIKPLSLYAPAIDSGKFNWSYSIVDEPVKKIQEQDGSLRDWPQNSDGIYTHKNISLANALAFSTNTVAVKLLQEIGVKNSIAILEENYGIDVDFEKEKMNNSGESEILGNIALGYLHKGVSVVDMAGYYQVFANRGVYFAPVSVDEIFSEAGSIYKTKYSFKKAMSVDTAEIMNRMLQRVVSAGTGKDAQLTNVAVGGKTGTTTDNEDNWFVGFTPEYSCAVWHSKAENGNICPKVFGSIFENSEITVKDFPGGGNIETKLYCEKSGLLRGDKCIYCNKGYYLRSQELKQCKECG